MMKKQKQKLQKWLVDSQSLGSLKGCKNQLGKGRLTLLALEETLEKVCQLFLQDWHCI